MTRIGLENMAEPVSVERIMNALRNCYDPEIPVNIVDLGLIYSVAVVDDTVKVLMTLTTQGCPAHAYLMRQVQSEIERIPGIKSAEVEIVWEPPWTPDRMSPETRKRLEAAQEAVTIEFNRTTFKPMKKGHIAKNADNGQVVLINESNKRYSGNDDIALIWEKSTGEKTVDEIITDVAHVKNLSPVEVRDQLLEMITQLISIGLLYPEEAIVLPLHS